MTRRSLFPPRPARPRHEPIVPMINVVFLLLIFFLLSARIAPPDPFDVTLPEGEAGPDDAPLALYLSATGEIAYGDARGQDAIRIAAQAGSVAIRADASAPAADLAGLLTQLTNAGAQKLALVTGGP